MKNEKKVFSRIIGDSVKILANLSDTDLVSISEFSTFSNEVSDRLLTRRRGNFEPDLHDAVKIVSKLINWEEDESRDGSGNGDELVTLKRVLGKEGWKFFSEINRKKRPVTRRPVSTEIGNAALDYISAVASGEKYAERMRRIFVSLLGLDLISQFKKLQDNSIQLSGNLTLFRGIAHDTKKYPLVTETSSAFTYFTLSEKVALEHAEKDSLSGEEGESSGILMEVTFPRGTRIFPLLLCSRAIDQFEFLLLDQGKFEPIAQEITPEISSGKIRRCEYWFVRSEKMQHELDSFIESKKSEYSNFFESLEK